jgi:beta-1,4-mannosyltransferase
VRQDPPPAAVRVLQSVRAPSATTNPYVVQLVRSMPPDVEAVWFTWRRALLESFDVLHLHWPDVLLAKPSRPGRLLARVRVALLVLRLALLRTPVVRTAHNLVPHERQGRTDRALLGALDRLTRHWIVLNAATPAPERRSTLVLHGDYRSWFAAAAEEERLPRRLLYFGLVRPYKGVPELLSAFAALPDEVATLHVLGQPSTPGLRQEVEQAAAGDPRVTVRLRHVDDDELACAVQQAQLVVLPYRELHNSGALLLALSFGRPVLVPENPVTLALGDEVGPGWVRTYSGPLTPGVLASALRATDGPPGGGPDLSRRAWPELGRQHAAVYWRVLRGDVA